MQKKPSQLDHALYNTTSRYEDFAVVHINQTRYVHRNALFFAWHRGFISLYEHALARECGFKGTLPYWDWVKNANLTTSPLFDGSDYSLSGQGLPIPPEDRFTPCNGAILVCAPGPGGGCVTDGPFKNYTWGFLSIPFSAITDPKPGLPADAFAYTPRCFSRDLNQYVASTYLTAARVRALMSRTSMADFLADIDNGALHPAGHAVTGGLNSGIFASPHEPTFYLHHAMIDRLWTQWQAKDPWDRTYGDNAFAGTVTSFNIPPSANATADTILTWGPLGPDRKLHDLLAIGRGGLCYSYT